MLIESGVGDAYGLAWEFSRAQTAPNDLTGYHRHPVRSEIPAGRYSDDTMRAIANARVVLGDPDDWFRPAAYAAAYQRIHAEDPRQGWSRGFQSYLEQNRDSSPERFMAGLRRRATNGAVMGVAPLGFLPDENAVRLAATCQCISTHSAAAESAAQTIALAAHYLLFDKGPKHALVEYLAKEVDWISQDERRRILCENGYPLPRPEMPAWTIAADAIAIVSDMTSLSAMLKDCVELGREMPKGGDTDSLAAVVMAVASCSNSVEADLPSVLLDGLEDEAGRGALRDLDARLVDFAGLGPVRSPSC
jgi:ADP-ribosylglycohydrolase